MESTEEKPYGLLAEFDSPDALIEAATAVRDSGYKRIDAFSPFPVHGLAEAVGMHGTRLPLLVLICGTLGGLGGFFLQYFAAVISFPYNVGGRPFNSWPAFIPVTFEMTILASAFGAVLGMLAFNGLPTPYHSLFNVEEFALATRDHFFLIVESKDPKFHPSQTREFLESLKPQRVYEVEP